MIPTVVKLNDYVLSKTPDSFKQALAAVERKISILEKRKSQIQSYQEDQQSGRTLTDYQQSAVEKLDDVQVTLDNFVALLAQFKYIACNAVHMQEQKAINATLDNMRHSTAKIKEILGIHEVAQYVMEEVITLLEATRDIKFIEDEEFRLLLERLSEVTARAAPASAVVAAPPRHPPVFEDISLVTPEVLDLVSPEATPETTPQTMPESTPESTTVTTPNYSPAASPALPPSRLWGVVRMLWTPPTPPTSLLRRRYHPYHQQHHQQHHQKQLQMVQLQPQQQQQHPQQQQQHHQQHQPHHQQQLQMVQLQP